MSARYSCTWRLSHQCAISCASWGPTCVHQTHPETLQNNRHMKCRPFITWATLKLQAVAIIPFKHLQNHKPKNCLKFHTTYQGMLFQNFQLWFLVSDRSFGLRNISSDHLEFRAMITPPLMRLWPFFNQSSSVRKTSMFWSCLETGGQRRAVAVAYHFCWTLWVIYEWFKGSS